MALVDLTSVTTGSIGTNTNFIVEENKVLKRISQSSLLKTSAISTTHVNSTTNVPSSSLVYSMNQAINTLNSDAIKQFNYAQTVFDFDDPSYEAGMYRLGSTLYLQNSPGDHMNYGNVLVIRNNSTDTLTMLAFTFNQRGIFFKSSNESSWTDGEWGSLATKDDINPVYKVLNLTSQFNPLGASYSLKMYGFVYIHLGFTTTRQPSEGDDIVQIIDTGDIAPVSTVAFTSRQGGYATFKIDSGSKNLRIGGTPPEADHTFVIDAIFKLN